MPVITLRAAAFAFLAVCAGFGIAAAQDPVPLCEATPHMTALRFTIGTGGDDLRGGSDNVLALVRVARAPDWITIPIHGGLNRGARWADWTNHIVDAPIGGGSCPPSPSLILAIRLKTTFGGGMGGDNWNLQSVHVAWVGTDASGAPATGVLANVPSPGRSRYLHRFTGDNIPYDVPLLPH